MAYFIPTQAFPRNRKKILLKCEKWVKFLHCSNFTYMHWIENIKLHFIQIWVFHVPEMFHYPNLPSVPSHLHLHKNRRSPSHLVSNAQFCMAQIGPITKHAHKALPVILYSMHFQFSIQSFILLVPFEIPKIILLYSQYKRWSTSLLLDIDFLVNKYNF